MTFDLEKESLKASGIKNLLRVSEYLGKLNHIYNEFQKKLSTESKSQYDKAKVLFDWLWQKKRLSL